MKPEDEKVLNVWLKEADQQVIDEVLQSATACEQLDQLEADMNCIDQATDHANETHNPLPADYGQQLWMEIADQLPNAPVANKATANWWQKLTQMLLQPQFSLASLMLVAGLVMVAFYAGQRHPNGSFSNQMQEQLLAQNIQLHLTQSEIFLTQVSNGVVTANTQVTAQRLLTSNRLFKQALGQFDGQLTQQVLQNLEPVLLEYANSGSRPQDNTLIHGQPPHASWVNDSRSDQLMFQVKTMQKQLAQKNDII